MSNWANDGTTWLWYEGTIEELEEMKSAAEERWKSSVQFGNPEPLSGTGTRKPGQWIYYMAFVFSNSEDAMLFKLSY